MPKYFHHRGNLNKTAHKYLQYKVVIYRNFKQYKILYKSRVIFPAQKRYKQYLENNQVYFPVKWDKYGKLIQYQLLLLGNWGEVMDKYTAPSGVVYNVGRITNDGFRIKNIQPYYLEEKFKYFKTKKIVRFKDVITLMMKERGTKTIMAVHNKLLIEVIEKEDMHLFILKNENDAQRLYKAIKQFYYLNKMSDCFFFKKPARGLELNALYARIVAITGIRQSELWKNSTGKLLK